jgi:hypothetical protein
MTLKELKMQLALGTLPDEYRHPMCTKNKLQTAKGTRTCHFCGGKIKRDEQCYKIPIVASYYFNICMKCSYMPIGHILPLLED